MKWNQRRVSQITFAIGILGVLTFSVAQFQNCAPPSGNPSVPCKGKNCSQPSRGTGGDVGGRGSGNNPPPGGGGSNVNTTSDDTGGDNAGSPGSPGVDGPRPSPTPSQPSRYPATARCSFTFDFDQTDKPAGFTRYSNPDIIPEEKNITEIANTTDENYRKAGFIKDLWINNTRSNFTARCNQAAYDKFVELEMRYCGKTLAPKLIRSRARIDYTYKDGGTGYMETINPASGSQVFQCKPHDVISANTVYGGVLPGGPSKFANPPGGFLCTGYGCSHPSSVYGVNAGDLTAIIVDTSTTPALGFFASGNQFYGFVDHLEFQAAYLTGNHLQGDVGCGNKPNILRIEIPTPYSQANTEIPVYGINLNGQFGSTVNVKVELPTRGWIILRSCTPLQVKNLKVFVR